MQINIGTIYKLRRVDAESLHETMRLTYACFSRFAVGKHDFKFKKIAQALNSVQMNPRSANKIQGSMLTHASDRPVGQGQGLAKHLRRRRRSSNKERLFRSMLVRSAIEDEFTRIATQDTQLQSSVFASKERIVLLDFDWTSTRDFSYLGHERLNALDVRLDLNVPRHGSRGV